MNIDDDDGAGRCDVTLFQTMWSTKVADNKFSVSSRLRDIISTQLSMCCSNKPSIRRSADALVPHTTSCSMPASTTCSGRCRCKWMRVVCTKGFLIIVNLLFLVRMLIVQPHLLNWAVSRQISAAHLRRFEIHPSPLDVGGVAQC